MMKLKSSILIYLTLAGLSYGQKIIISTNDANLFTNNSIKLEPVSDTDALQIEPDSIIIPKAKQGHSQTFNGSSTEESLISLVEETIARDPDQACEVVKKAIGMSKAQDALICRIVESAILAAPDQIRLITQCAIASAPDSLTSIQILLATYDASGDASSSGKEVSGKEVSGKEVSGKEVAKTAEDKDIGGLKPVDLMTRTSLGTPSTSSPARMYPLNSAPPSSISPNAATGNEISTP